MISFANSLELITNSELRDKWAQIGPAVRKALQKEWRRITRRYPDQVSADWKHGADGFDGAMLFFRDVGPRPSMCHRVSRHDNSMPFERGNVYWSVIGRRSTKIIVAGQEIPLSDAALLADVNEASVLSRARKLTIESCILTPKSCRYPYPHDKAVQFLSKLELLSYAALDIVEAERNRWGNKNPAKKKLRKIEIEDRHHALLHSAAADNIGRVLLLPIPSADKIRLLAYYSMPSEVKKSTRGVWKGIITRCTDTTHPKFPNYGGRGIKACRTWIRGAGGLSGLQCFVADMGCWQPGMEIDRIDPDGNYEMSNCRWVGRKQNVNNIFTWQDVYQRLADMEQALQHIPTGNLPDSSNSQWSATKKLYASIVSRCTDPTNQSWGYYGGRGIRVCERWLLGDGQHNGFECFVLDVGLQPVGMQLDRIDNDGNYEPTNCRWLSPEANKRNSWRWSHLMDRIESMHQAQSLAEQVKADRITAKPIARD